MALVGGARVERGDEHELEGLLLGVVSDDLRIGRKHDNGGDGMVGWLWLSGAVRDGDG